MKDKQDYFQIWFEDKQSILATMVKNMNADIDAGYDPLGNNIRKQLEAIHKYYDEFDAEMKHIGDMDENKVNWWCYVDLKRRGAIS